jgi:hypothetical protein
MVAKIKNSWIHGAWVDVRNLVYNFQSDEVLADYVHAAEQKKIFRPNLHNHRWGLIFLA